MVGNMLARPHIRFMTDALMGLAVFGGLTLALLAPSSAAGVAAPLLSAPAPMTAIAAASQLTLQPNLIMLAVVFSTLFALNLSFIRHLANAYRHAHRRAPSKHRAPPH